MSSPQHHPPGPDEPLLFGRFALHPGSRLLLCDGQATALGGRALDLLVVMARQPGTLLSREALLDAVWPDSVVEENNLSVQVNTLRKVLGPGHIHTMPGRGYRFGMPPAGPVAVPGGGLPDPTSAPTHLPASPAVLFGRDADLAALEALLATQRLLTLTGAAGIGKTCLAQALMHRARDRFAQGVCFVDLSVLQPGDDPAQAVLSALGLPAPGGEPLAALVRSLAPQQLLLGLDNAEHLAAPVAAMVAGLLHGSSGLRLLVTSQAPLRVPQEWVFRVSGLAVPPAGASLAQAAGHGAVALFSARAGARGSGFVLDAGNVAQVVALCRQLDGAALAIELAAARLPMLGLAGLVQALARPLDALVLPVGASVPRHRSLRSALAWSHALLGAPAQAVFRRFAVFVGGAPLSLLRQVLGGAGGGADDWAMLDALEDLIDRALVSLVPGERGADDPDPRYRLLEAPLALAREALQASGESAWLQRRHARALASRLQQAHARLLEGNLPARVFAALLEPDLDNAQAALRWALVQAPPLAVAMAPALSAALGSHRYSRCVDLWQRVEPLLDGPPALPDVLRAPALLQCAEHWQNTRVALALDRARAAEALALRLGDVRLRYLAQRVIGFVCFRLGDRAGLEAAAATARALERPDWSAYVRVVGAGTEAWLRLLDGDHPATIHWCRVQAGLQRAAGSSDSGVMVKIIGAQMLAGLLDDCIATARALADQLAGAREQQHRCYALSNLSAALLMQGRTAEARPVLAHSWALAAQFGLQAQWTDDAAMLAALEQRPRAALCLAGHADQAFAALGSRREALDQQRADQTASLALQALGSTPDAPEVLWRRQEGAALRFDALLPLALATDDA